MNNKHTSLSIIVFFCVISLFSYAVSNNAYGESPTPTPTPTATPTPSKSPSPTNRCPVTDPIGETTIKEGESLTLTISATDSDGNTLRYSASNLPPGATFEGQTFKWTPEKGQAGTYDDVKIEVSDCDDDTAKGNALLCCIFPLWPIIKVIAVPFEPSPTPSSSPNPSPSPSPNPSPTPSPGCKYSSDCHTDAETECELMCEAGECVSNGHTYCSDGSCIWASDTCPTLPTPTPTPTPKPTPTTPTPTTPTPTPPTPTPKPNPTASPTPTPSPFSSPSPSPTPTQSPSPSPSPEPSPTPKPSPSPSPSQSPTPSPTPTPTPTPSPSPGPSPEPSPTPTSSPIPPATCTSTYGPGYTDCTTGSEAEIKDRLCCARDEECCKKDETAPPVCCSKEMCWNEKKKEVRCQVCAHDKTEKTKIPFNYCYIQGCPKHLQLCPGSYQNICCKKEPEEYCGVQYRGWWGVFKKAYCSKYPTECPKPETYECPQPEEYRTDKEGPPLCCKTGMEYCLPDKHFKGIVYCNPYKCEFGEPCKGRGDYEGYDICCDQGQTCFQHPNGYRRCVTAIPSESTAAGESISTRSFSIYLHRTPTGEEFQRDGIAYRFRPHGLKFSKDIGIYIKDFKPTEMLYKYPDESYINSCSVEVLGEWNIAVGPAGKSIINEYFEFQIPPGALAEDTAITIDRIDIACPREPCCGQDPLTPPALQAIDEYYQGDLTKEELQSVIDSWIESGVKEINFDNYPVSSYAGAQDANPKIISIEDDGVTLHIAGNAWKRIDSPYTVTSRTVIEFDFKSDREGGIHGIGFDTDLVASPKYTFKLYGTRRWGRLRYDNYTSSDGWKHYKIPIGRYYTGSFPYLFFVNDDDTHSAADSYFKNVKVYEK